MRPGQQQNKQRMRGRGRKGPNPLSRSYESNGPDVKIRGTAQHIAEKYSTLARDSAASGDRVMAENYLQHAEHYGRIVAAAQGSFQLQQDENDLGDQNEDDGDEDGGNDAGYSNGSGSQNGQPYSQDRSQQDRGQQERQPDRQDRQADRGQQDRNQGDRNQNDRSQNDRSQNDRNQGDRGNPPAMRDNRDGNREGNRQNSGNRENNRDGRDPVRDGNRGNRDANREGGNREFGRDNRDGRDGSQRETREGFQNREHQGNRDRAAPNGLGPQPVLTDNRPVADAPRHGSTHDQALNEAVQRDRVDAPSGEQPREEFRLRSEEPNVEREPRRRGRPRRVRPEDGAADANAGAAPEAVQAYEGGSRQPAVEPQASLQPAEVSRPAAEPASSEPRVDVATEAAPDGEAKVKRKPGRPRKKKPEDDGPDGEGGSGGGDHLPAFLMASNG